jgi:hypothetical protein
MKHLLQELKSKLIVYLILLSVGITGCDIKEKKVTPTKATYVSPSINYKGQFRPGYVRKSVSLNPNAIRNQTRSKYYYKTKGKYRRKHKP